jgi:hypothetical protein
MKLEADLPQSLAARLEAFTKPADADSAGY